jgi:predicted molibdopterin-dependent oxidoreductase YjgC
MIDLKWYSYDSDSMILCSDCVNKSLADTTLATHERLDKTKLVILNDADVEPYQCDGCLTQNDAYENIGDDVD